MFSYKVSKQPKDNDKGYSLQNYSLLLIKEKNTAENVYQILD